MFSISSIVANKSTVYLHNIRRLYQTVSVSSSVFYKGVMLLKSPDPRHAAMYSSDVIFIKSKAHGKT